MGRQIDGGNVVWVFVMTPHADAQERAVFHDVIDEVNDVKARVHGVQFKPMGPSESMLGRLRPKALRNKDLLSANLVVVVLWRHWDPDEAARFEAFYDLARDNDKEVWLYVRALNDALLAHPDESLRHVLAFRDRVEQEGRVRYIRYDSVADWQEKLLQHLFHWLDNLPSLDPSLGLLAPDDLDARLAVFAATPPDTLDRLREAWTFAEAGRLTRAHEHFARFAETPTPAVQMEYARFLGHLGALERAEALYKKVLDLDASADAEGLVAAGYGHLGHAYEQRGDLDEARRLYRESLHINERLDRPEAMATDYGSLGNVYWMQGALTRAEHAYREALLLNEKLDRLSRMAADYSNLGNVYGVWGRLDEAEKMYQTALELNERLGRQESLANQYGNLGIIYRVQGRLDEAEEVYRKALEINRAIGRHESLAEDYSNLGNVYQERNRFREAEQMYRKALEIDEGLGRHEGMANQYGNLGVVYQAREMFEEAEQMYRRALALFETLGDFATIEQVRIWITDLEMQRRMQ